MRRHCRVCDEELAPLEQFGDHTEPLCWDHYAELNAEAGQPVYGLGPHEHRYDPETGRIMTIMHDQSPTEEFMPDPDAPGLGVWMPKPLPGWR